MANNLVEGLQVALLGIGIVFLLLFFLSLILELFSKFFYDEETGTGVKSGRRSQSQKGTHKKAAAVDNQKNMAIISSIMAEVLDEDQYVVNINKIN